MAQASPQDVAPATITAAVCGNPNSGKTTIFNALTGLRQRVGNYPGVTVERVTGEFAVTDERIAAVSVCDVPGSYSLAAYSPDEYIAAQVLFGRFEGKPPDVIVCVIDATNIERGLYLLFQVLEVGRPVVVALNMMDLARRHGLEIDVDGLGRELGGVPVVPMVAARGEGIAELKAAIVAAARAGATASRLSFYHPLTIEATGALAPPAHNGYHGRAEYLRVLFDADGPAEREYLQRAGTDSAERLARVRRRLLEQFGSLAAAETGPLMEQAQRIAAQVVRQTRPARSYSERLDRFILHPVLGPVILVVVLLTMFQSVFAWAEPVMAFIDGFFGSLAGLVESAMPAGPLRSLLTDGVIGGVGSVIVFLPQIVILFVFISILEDSGYLPRAAFLADRLFSWCGLSGKSLIPLLTSFACGVPGIMATRTIDDRRVRLTTILVAPLMSCSARLPVYSIMIAAFIPYRTVLGIFNLQGLALAAMYFLGVFVAVIVSLVMSRFVHRRARGSFLMEMPAYRMPTLAVVGMRVWTRARMFLVRAGTIILAITIIIWALSYYPRGDTQPPAETAALQESVSSPSAEAENLSAASRQLRNSYLGRAGRFLEPVFRPLGWDWKITVGALASFPAREVIIATLGTIYNLDDTGSENRQSLVTRLREARWDHGPKLGQPVFGPAVALSIMVFFALCAQCAATLVTIRQETGKWIYPVATFAYMTTLAYVGALVVYQVFSRLGW